MRSNVPRSIIRLLVAMVILAGCVPLFQPSPASADTPELYMPRYFSETGFWVQGHFREYWESRGGLFVFGYPITSVFENDGLQKQYFQRAIFEYHPEHAGTEYEVLLQRLGSVRAEGREREEPFLPLDVASDQNCDFHPESGHRLCFGFRAFWTHNGGLQNFGYPISEEFDERNEPPPAGDGEVHTVQYFERTRIEWHPEHQGTEYEFLLGLLGSEYLAIHGAPDEALVRQPADLPPPDPITGRVYGPPVGLGFNIAWRGDEQSGPFHDQTLAKVNEAGFSWIRIQIAWSEFETEQGKYVFSPIDRLVDAARARNVRVLASVAKAPTWATGDGTDGIPPNPEALGAFMGQLAEHFRGRIDAYEIWNEQNLAHETGGFIDMGRYVNILKSGYTAVKQGDPDAIVVFGGLTPTGVNDPHVAIDDVQYLRDIYAYNGGEIKNYYDVLGAHPGSNNNPPDTMWPGNPGPGEWTTHESFYFRRVEQIRQVMVENGEAHKQVWLTEFGWTTANPAAGYEYGVDNSEQNQADYLVRAYEIARSEWPWMGPMFVWNLNFQVIVDPADEKGPWGVLNADWSNRPAFEALKNMPK